MQASTPRKAIRRSLALGIPPIARRLVGWWSRSVMTRGEKWARASLVSMGMEADPRSFPEAADLAWYPDRLV